MVTALLLAACGPPQVSVTTIPGVQVVAIVADPPQPAALDQMKLDVWVADGIGLGAEVLVWICTPVEGRCLEAGPANVDGLPLVLWTKTGTANPKLTVESTFWPLLGAAVANSVDLPTDYSDGFLVVWALACVPGYCPVMDEVDIGPLPGSEAWDRIAEGLARPQQWVEDVPLGYSSIAVKLVPLWRPDQPTISTFYNSTDETGVPAGRNSAPLLEESDFPPRVDAPMEGFPPLWVMLNETDPDGDDLRRIAFTTSGLVTADLNVASGGLEVLWSPQAADADRSPQVFVVTDDQRGGTAVWASDPGADPATCAQPASVELTQPAFPGDVVVAELTGAPAQASVTVSGLVQGEGASTSLGVDIQLRDTESGELLAVSDPALPAFVDIDGPTCTATFSTGLRRATTLPVTGLCDFGGSVVDVQATVTDIAGAVTTTTTTQAILHLDPTLPCLE